MKETLILIQNITIQSKAPEEIIEMVNEVRDSLEDVFTAIKEGEQL